MSRGPNFADAAPPPPPPRWSVGRALAWMMLALALAGWCWMVVHLG